MGRTGWLLLRILLLLAVVGVVGLSAADFLDQAGVAQEINQIQGPTFLKWLARVSTGLVSAGLLGVLTVAAIFFALRAQYKPVFIISVAVFAIILARTFFFTTSDAGEASFFGPNFNRGIVIDGDQQDAEWPVPGGDAASGMHFASQAPGYSIKQGWAATGAIFSYRLLDFGFGSGLIPLILYLGVLRSIWLAHRNNTVRPIVVHGIAILLLGFILLWPTIELGTQGENPVLAATYSQAADDGNFVDAPRLSNVQYAAWVWPTAIIDELGSRVIGRNRASNTIILDAATRARLGDGLDEYMKYSSLCFTAVYNLNKMRQEPGKMVPESELHRFITDKYGDANSAEVGQALGQFSESPMWARHALSAYSDALFDNLAWPLFVPVGQTQDWTIPRWGTAAAMKQQYEPLVGYSGVRVWQQPYGPSSNPWMGAGYIMALDESRTYAFGYEQRHLGLSTFQIQSETLTGHGTVLQRPSEMQQVEVCSAKITDDAKANSLLELSKADPIGYLGEYDPKWKANGYDPRYAVPAAWAVRAKIAQRFLGKNSVNYCREVGPDSKPEDLWGCLVAQRYDLMDADGDVGIEQMKQIQEEFNLLLADRLAENVWPEPVGNGTLYTDYRIGDPAGNYKPGQWGELDEAYAPFEQAMFVDMLLAAPGIQQQIGMGQDFRSRDEPEGEGWVWWLLRQIGGPIIASILGIFAWFATLLADFALMAYAHVSGIVLMYLLIRFLPDAVASLWPGNYFWILGWVKAMVWLCMWDLCFAMGLAFIEQASGFGLITLHATAQQGMDVTAPMMKMLGAMLILGAPGLAAGLMTLGFNGLKAVSDTITSGMMRAATITAGATALVAAGVGAAVTAGFTGGLSLLGAKLLGVSAVAAGAGATKAAAGATAAGAASTSAVAAGTKAGMGAKAAHAVGRGAQAAARGLDMAGRAGTRIVSSGIEAASTIHPESAHLGRAAGQALQSGVRTGSKAGSSLVRSLGRTGPKTAQENANQGAGFAAEADDARRAGNSVVARDNSASSGNRFSEAAKLTQDDLRAASFGQSAAEQYLNAGMAKEAMRERAEVGQRMGAIDPGRLSDPVVQTDLRAMEARNQLIDMRLALASGDTSALRQGVQAAQAGLSTAVREVASSMPQQGDQSFDSWRSFNQATAATTRVAGVGVQMGALASSNGVDPGRMTPDGVAGTLGAPLDELATREVSYARASEGIIKLGQGDMTAAKSAFARGGVVMDQSQLEALRGSIARGDYTKVEDIMRRMKS